MPTINDTFLSISNQVEGNYRDKGSKFLAYALPIVHENDLKPVLELLKKQHFKAVHWCYAYRIGAKGEIFRANDDGEPSGSAGKPILNVLISKQLTNMAVVVVRYWGGTLLGVPGLINAYKTATEDALYNAVVVTKTLDNHFQLSFDYLAMNQVMKTVKDLSLKIDEQVFDNQCIMRVSFRASLTQNVLDLWQDIEGLNFEPI
jgi:uncharacterized YigZ family protein